MKRNDKDEVTSKADDPVVEQAGTSRRSFLKGAGVVGAAVAAATSGIIAMPKKSEAADDCPEPRVLEELPIPADPAAPSKTEFACDVLVVGGGFAGLNAAISAKKAGNSVIMVDKGRPGYSGLSPFASSHRWIDKNFGDDPKAFRACVQRGGEYITNLDWYQVWIDESKAAYERLMEWGVLTQFPKASIAGEYFNQLDYAGYRDKFDKFDRRKKFNEALDKSGVQIIERTMITEVIKNDGRVVGAMGIDVPSGAVVTFHAKAVVLCTGGGSFKSGGYPTGANSFTGEYIGYQLGLPIVGKEFDDFHQTVSHAAGNAFYNNSWTYLENIWLCGGDIDMKNYKPYADVKAKVMVLSRVHSALKGMAPDDGSHFEDLAKASKGRRGGSLSSNPLDPREGKKNDSMQKGDVWGAAVGMCSHLSSGVFCGLDDINGQTALPGLYVAGDGTNGCVVTGAAYPNGVGFTSNFISCQGWRVGEAAAKYARGVGSARIPLAKIASVTTEIEAPRGLTKGLDPNWARDVLHGIMAPYWVHIAKSEKTLQGTLAQVECMRDEVVPQLMAVSSHDLRLCHEMKSKILSAEMKLRAGIERKESRGFHFRTDYPYRDDKNFLCYIAATKGKNGMKVSKVQIKDEWKGDTGLAHADRYGWRFPGETEALGLPPEKKRDGGPGGKPGGKPGENHG